MLKKGDMKKMSSWVTHGFMEYLLVAELPEAVSKKVFEVREDFRNEYGGKSLGIPSIVLASFLSVESMEEVLIRWIQKICSTQPGFEIALNNYSGFPSHTIFLRVQDHEPFKKMSERLKVVDDYMQSSSCPSARLNAKPHLIIGKEIPPSIYVRAMMDYSQKSFYETFRIEELQLVRRVNQHDDGKKLNVFRFLPEAVMADHDH